MTPWTIRLKRALLSPPAAVAVGLAVLYALFLLGGRGPLEGEYTVRAVVDGDTVELAGLPQRVRLEGIDAPEPPYEDSPGDPLGREASLFLRRMIEGERVRFEPSRERYDRYGRLLGYLFAGDTMVNAELVRRGLAMVLFMGPSPPKYARQLTRALEEARRARAGIWGDLGRLLPPPGNERFVVTAAEAAGRTGERVVVRGRVTAVAMRERYVGLRLDGVLDVLIFRSNLDNFRFFGIDPATHYRGKVVEATGRVVRRRRGPALYVRHPMVLRVVRGDG